MKSRMQRRSGGFSGTWTTCCERMAIWAPCGRTS